MSDLFTATTASEVEECLARGDKLEQERREGRWDKQTPLISSIKRGNKQVFFSLLQHGADPNHNPPGDWKPIQWAAFEGWKDMVEALVKAGADVNENEREKRAPLWIAAEKGAVDVTEGLLALGADTEITDEEGWTPLMVACKKGHEVVVDRLLAAGAVVNSVNEDSYSPLILASMNGHLGIVDRLVIHGANINYKDNGKSFHNEWVLLENLDLSDDEIDPLLLGDADLNLFKKSALMWAFTRGHLHVVERLLGLGCDLDLQDEEEKTILMKACQRGQVEVVKILLAHGADTQIKDMNGKKAIDLTQSQEIKDLLQG